jgi:hypothetical protein
VPNQASEIHIIILSNIFNIALTQAPLSKRVRVSIEKEEKVVYPPKKPINNKALNCGAIPSNRIVGQEIQTTKGW